MAKSAIFGNTPAGKWFGPRIVVPWNFLKNLISTIWDSFHVGASPSYDFFFRVTDGQNSNAELITLGNQIPASDLGRGSRDRRENLHKGRVRCKLQDCIVRLFFIIIFYFILINYANLCKKNNSYFHYKSLIKASRLLIFGIYILFNILSNCAVKNVSIEINLCILLCYEFLMYFLVFLTFFFFFAEICCRHFLKYYLAKINSIQSLKVKIITVL